ncbi:MAG: hypothetical protein COV59_05145 [Candidatus Magasanikbacteria bacterium CG11_big_fil_rev_8_21_14_0_20_39_34]|uniref:Uncharacterized protein n=1 Tax=Candidatus Magasanikbacteria bacterium CG11_big_fil_rev_8_21_14_0_20_39_34 TaxID=1974653 RepID=A0A2H0N3U3_9BACT|nr:MAG: hypothetical protein COV59_05145 [Candidatus Magasanikbacteria bacterium CG11_big_fil_rev_8_21_14_0_20_39_34]
MHYKKHYIFIALFIPTLFIFLSLLGLKILSYSQKYSDENTVQKENTHKEKAVLQTNEQLGQKIQEVLDTKKSSASSLCKERAEGYYLSNVVFTLPGMDRFTEGSVTVLCHGNKYIPGSYIQRFFLEDGIDRPLAYAYENFATFETPNEIHIFLKRRNRSQMSETLPLQTYISLDKKTDTFTLRKLAPIEDSHGVVPLFLPRGEQKSDLLSKGILGFAYTIFEDQKSIVYVYQQDQGEEVWSYNFEKNETSLQTRLDTWDLLSCDQNGKCNLKEKRMKWQDHILIVSKEPFICDKQGYYLDDFVDIDMTHFICHDHTVIYDLDTKAFVENSDNLDPDYIYPSIQEYFQVQDGRNRRMYFIWAYGCDGACAGIEKHYVSIDKDDTVTMKKMDSDSGLFDKGTLLLQPRLSPDKTKMLFMDIELSDEGTGVKKRVIKVFNFLKEQETTIQVLAPDQFLFQCEMGCYFLDGAKLDWSGDKPLVLTKSYDELTENQKMLLFVSPNGE